MSFMALGGNLCLDGLAVLTVKPAVRAEVHAVPENGEVVSSFPKASCVK